MAEQESRSKWRFRWSVRSLLVFVALVSLGLGLWAAYFHTAKIEGNVRFGACACGLTPATVADGKVVLAEQNHDRPAGTVLATIEIKGRVCTLRRIGEDGAAGPAETLQVDHLGAKFYDEPTYGTQPVYVVIVDNWKLYPAYAIFWIRRMFR
jgi:hypothetical protein